MGREAENISVEKRHVVGDQQDADDNQQHAAADVDRLHVAAQALGELKERIDRQRAQKKWQGKARCVARQQHRAAAHFTGGAGKRQRRSQNRPDARCPSHGKSHPDKYRAEITRRLVLEIKLQVTIERSNLEKSDEIKSDEENKRSAENSDCVSITEENSAEKARRRAEGDKNQ